MHIASGRLLLSGQWPATDPFSFTAAGEPWHYRAWLSQVVFAGVYDLLGVAGLVLLTAVVSAAAAGLIALVARRLGGGVHGIVAAPTIWLALGGYRAWQLRPHVVAPLGLAALSLLLLEVDRRPRLAWLALLIGAAWMGLHSTAPLGVGLIVGATAWQHLVERRPVAWKARALLLLCFVVGMVTQPNLPGWLHHATDVGAIDPAITPSDWWSWPLGISLGRVSARMAVGGLALLVAGWVAIGVRRDRPPWILAAASCAAIGAFVWARFVGDLLVPLAAMSTAVVLARVPVHARRGAATAMVGVALAMSLAFGRAPGLGFDWEAPPTGPPIAATDAVAAALQPIDGEQRWYTDATSGGWVMMTQYERGVRVALDGRILNVYPPDLVMELVARARDAQALLAWLDEVGVVAVVIERELPENDALGLADARWALVWVDEGTYGYVRRDHLATPDAELRCFRHMT